MDSILTATSRWYTWLFEGLGTELLMFALGILLGGLGGYRLGIKQNGVQKQKARGQSEQEQQIEVDKNRHKERGGGINGNILQTQKAGKKSRQRQIGRIK